jgi:hypothetical protein
MIGARASTAAGAAAGSLLEPINSRERRPPVRTANEVHY